MPREDAAVGELIGEALREEGIELRLGAGAREGARTAGGRRVRLDDGTDLEAEQLLVAVGRTPRVAGIGLEAVGIEPSPRGVDVDERRRAAEGLWAIGDATGVMPFTHVGMYLARVVVDDITGKPRRADYDSIPRVVFSDSEIGAVGLTEAQARERGIEVATARIGLADAIARPWTYEKDPRGVLELIADREQRTLVGAWAVAPLAGEWIHYAALAIKARISLELLRDTVSRFPTYSEAYLKGVEALERQ